MTYADARKHLFHRADNTERLPLLLRWHEDGDIDRDTAIRLLGDVWSSCDDINLYVYDVSNILPKTGPVPSMMTATERKALAALPDVVTVYRGHGENVNEFGLSWTLNVTTATGFAMMWRMMSMTPVLVTGRVRRRDILAVKLGRNEAEIIARRVKVVSIERFPDEDEDEDETALR